MAMQYLSYYKYNSIVLAGLRKMKKKHFYYTWYRLRIMHGIVYDEEPLMHLRMDSQPVK